MPKLQVRVDLDGEIAEKFEALKRKTGISSNAQLVRFMVSYMYEDIVERGRPFSPEERAELEGWEKRKLDALKSIADPEFLNWLLEHTDELEVLKKLYEELKSKSGAK